MLSHTIYDAFYKAMGWLAICIMFKLQYTPDNSGQTG